MMTIDQAKNITHTIDANDITPLDETTTHETPTGSHYDTIVTSMTANGWQGAPIAYWSGNIAITGTHRIHAARATGTNVHAIDLCDLDDDFEAITVAAMSNIDTWGWDSSVAATGVARLILGDKTADWLGLDIEVNMDDAISCLDLDNDADYDTILVALRAL